MPEQENNLGPVIPGPPSPEELERRARESELSEMADLESAFNEPHSESDASQSAAPVNLVTDLYRHAGADDSGMFSLLWKIITRAPIPMAETDDSQEPLVVGEVLPLQEYIPIMMAHGIRSRPHERWFAAERYHSANVGHVLTSELEGQTRYACAVMENPLPLAVYTMSYLIGQAFFRHTRGLDVLPSNTSDLSHEVFSNLAAQIGYRIVYGIRRDEKAWVKPEIIEGLPVEFTVGGRSQLEGEATARSLVRSAGISRAFSTYLD